MAEPLGKATAERWRRAGAGGDLIVPVPVHAERARLRGYDQALLLARVIEIASICRPCRCSSDIAARSPSSISIGPIAART